jgi:hypothetical protein
MLGRLFGEKYNIQSFCFSPVDLGVPSNRPRRYSILILKSLFVARLSYDAAGFGGLFFQRTIMDGHIYWFTSRDEVGAYTRSMAEKKHLPDSKPDSQSWSMRDVLPEAEYQQLLGYERRCMKKRGRLELIVNLGQNFTFDKSSTTICPSLLTRTSTLWSMRAERLLLPLEHLCVMGIPAMEALAEIHPMHPAERLFRSGQLSIGQLKRLVGNAMHQISIGSVLLFALGTSQRRVACVLARPLCAGGGGDSDQSEDDLQ